ncbi:tripartite tricarboxylate transporter substrate binding protein [Comamonas humi]
MPLALLACLPLVLGSAASGQTFPGKPVRLIVPYPPGASTDSMARAFAAEFGREAGGSVVVENKPGGGGAIAALAMKNMAADGHALLFQTGELLATKLTNPKLRYEFRDFEVIAPLAQTPFVLIVPAQNHINSLDDLKAYAARKGDLTIGSLGTGMNSYTVMSRRVAQQLDVRARMVPYKGGMEGVTAVMAGEIDAYFATVGLAHAQKDNKKIKLLAITSAEESKFLPGIRPFSQLGFRDLEFYSFYGIAVRSDTPESIKQQVQRLAAKATGSAELKKSRESISLEEFPGSLQDYQRVTLQTAQELKQLIDAEQKAPHAAQ